jgi:hypothetical protein
MAGKKNQKTHKDILEDVIEGRLDVENMIEIENASMEFGHGLEKIKNFLPIQSFEGVDLLNLLVELDKKMQDMLPEDALSEDKGISILENGMVELKAGLTEDDLKVFNEIADQQYDVFDALLGIYDVSVSD